MKAKAKEKDRAERLKLVKRALAVFPKIVKLHEQRAREKQKILKAFAPVTEKLAQEIETARYLRFAEKVHAWRQCPVGYYWVRVHDRTVRASSKNPSGITSVDGHCRKNRGEKDELHADEILGINSRIVPESEWLPNPSNLGFKTKLRNGTAFDEIIAIWTKYWNDIFKPTEPLDPDFVKALMASESDFAADTVTPAGKGQKAYGLMQLTGQTIKSLGGFKGELKDHLVVFTQADALNPAVNVAAATRWLFHKRERASKRLGRQATWEESLIEYKGYLNEYKKNPKGTFTGIVRFKELYENLQTSS